MNAEDREQMESEAKLLQDEAKQLLDNPLLKRIFEESYQDVINKWRLGLDEDNNPMTPEARESLFMKMKAIESLMAVLDNCAHAHDMFVINHPIITEK